MFCGKTLMKGWTEKMVQLGPEEKNVIIRHLIDKHAPWVIYLFGSFARGTARPNSDLDLALACDRAQGAYDLFITAQEIASKLHREVDVVDLNTASTVFQMQIVSTGKVLYCTDETRRISFEALVYKMYARLNEERKVILDQINETGTVYGPSQPGKEGNG
jgi:predicted nucleotidyltransferase